MIIAIISILAVWTLIGFAVLYKTKNTPVNVRTVIAAGPVWLWIGLIILFYLIAVEKLSRWVKKKS